VQEGADDPIELYNPTEGTLDLGACGVVDGDPAHDPYLFPPGAALEPGGYVVLRKERDHTFGPGDADSVRLFDVDGTLLDETSWLEGDASISLCRFPDGDGSWVACAVASLGGPNVLEFESVVVAPLFIAGLDRWQDADAGVLDPNELGFDGAGRLWAGDQLSLRVQVYGTDGTFLQSVGLGDFVPNPDDPGRQGPEAIRRADDGRMHVVDRGGDRVLVYDPVSFALVDTYAEGAGYVDLVGLATIGDRVFLADQGSDRIDEWTAAGVQGRAFETRPDGLDLLDSLETLALDPARGRLFASSEDVGRIEVFDLDDGTHIGGLCGPQLGPVPEPGRVADVVEGVYYDQVADRLYVSDEQNQRILVFDGASPALFDPLSGFAFLGSFGIGGTEPGQFVSADGVTVAPELDRLAVADQGNDRVQVFALSDIEAALGL
jgi:hypothetical protein